MVGRDESIVLDEHEVTAALVAVLAPVGDRAVVWASQGSEVVVHLDSVAIALSPGQVHATVDLACDATGRVAQPVDLTLAGPDDPPSLVATAGLSPAGDPVLAGRWGRVVQDAVWSAVLSLAGPDAVGVAADRGALIVHRVR